MLENNETVESGEVSKTFAPLPVANKPKSGRTGVATVSLVQTSTNGNRFFTSKTFNDRIGNPEKIKLAVTNGKLAVGADLPGVENSYPLHNYGKGKVVYNISLIHSLVEQFVLDFSCRTSITFSDVEFSEIEVNGSIVKVAYIRMEA